MAKTRSEKACQSGLQERTVSPVGCTTRNGYNSFCLNSFAFILHSLCFIFLCSPFVCVFLRAFVRAQMQLFFFTISFASSPLCLFARIRADANALVVFLLHLCYCYLLQFLNLSLFLCSFVCARKYIVFFCSFFFYFDFLFILIGLCLHSFVRGGASARK